MSNDAIASFFGTLSRIAKHSALMHPFTLTSLALFSHNQSALKLLGHTSFKESDVKEAKRHLRKTWLSYALVHRKIYKLAKTIVLESKYAKVGVNELRELLETAGLSSSGLKRALVTRLARHEVTKALKEIDMERLARANMRI
eukprot:TRINITY_DN2515_c0_g1_i8.p1 TRINITY_DN2515_c0_g1~~TRINITY_DN2515_c0_g1_i8.p1  ORF type:complete len:143 (-),score=2.67 TRINITY_DN2515_c0_g1_i8:362-790(-)